MSISSILPFLPTHLFVLTSIPNHSDLPTISFYTTLLLFLFLCGGVAGGEASRTTCFSFSFFLYFFLLAIFTCPSSSVLGCSLNYYYFFSNTIIHYIYRNLHWCYTSSNTSRVRTIAAATTTTITTALVVQLLCTPFVETSLVLLWPETSCCTSKSFNNFTQYDCHDEYHHLSSSSSVC